MLIHPLTMPQAHVHSPVDKAASLRREEIAAAKHEFVGGEIYAMAGKSERLTRIADNLFFRDEHDAWFEQKLSAENRIDVACDGTRLTLDDLYEDTGLLVV